MIDNVRWSVQNEQYVYSDVAGNRYTSNGEIIDRKRGFEFAVENIVRKIRTDRLLPDTVVEISAGMI